MPFVEIVGIMSLYRKVQESATKNGGWLAFNRGPEPSDYIETRKGIYGKEGILMCYYQLLSIQLSMFEIMVTLLVALLAKK